MPEKTNNTKIYINSESFDDKNSKTMIRINDVSMTFNMASEQLNNLKEYFLALVKHKLFYEELHALNNIDFEIKQGDVFGIVGTNGSGKSTLLKIVAGVLEPTNGSVEINGGIAPLIELGAGFDMELSARENIYLNGALLGHSKAFIDEHFDEIVEFSEIEKFLDMPMKNYSSGMIARIAFAIATIIIPEILIVDEVLSVGDFMFQKKCEDKILELIKNHNTTVLIVSHSNEQVKRLCNKAIWIEKGKTRMLGSAEEVCGVYGLVGGRLGSLDAEKSIIEASVQCKVDDPLSSTFLVQGSTYPEISLSLAKHAPKRAFDSVCLCSMQTHINVAFANALAGALNAPVVTIKHEGIDYSIIDWLQEHKPSKIIIFNLTDSPSPKELLSFNFDFQTEIKEFNCPLELFDITNYVLDNQKPILGTRKEAFLGTFRDHLESAILFAPISYSSKMPFLCVEPRLDPPEKLLGLCKKFGIEKIVNISQELDENYLNHLKSHGIKIEDVNKSDKRLTRLAITEKTMASIGKENDRELLIVPASPSQCTSASSAGFYASVVGAPSIVVDNTSLDSIADTVSFIKNHSVKKTTIIEGTEALSDPIIELFAKVAKNNN